MLRREEVERDLHDELQGYLEATAAENMRTGMSQEEAWRAARLALGSTDRVKEEVRAVGWENQIETCWHDIRYAARMLHNSPGFTIVAVLTLALGIGANVSLFSIVNTVLLQPLPFSDPSRLVMLWEGLPQLGSSRIPFSAPDFKFVERGQKSFEAIGALQNKAFDISGQGEPDRIIGARVSASIFPMLGVEPMLGRYFTAQEDGPGRNVVILSYGLWQRRYGGRADILGKTIDLERQPYTIVGVMPKRFVFPLPGPPANPFPAALWVPMAFTPDEVQAWGKRYSLSVLARLSPDVNVEQARSEGHLLAQSIQAQYPQAMLKDFYGARLDVPVFPWQQQVVGPVQPLLLVLMAAVGMVLLIACANVATLLLSRAAARQCARLWARRAAGFCNNSSLRVFCSPWLAEVAACCWR
jgi:predicted permease